MNTQHHHHKADPKDAIGQPAVPGSASPSIQDVCLGTIFCGFYGRVAAVGLMLDDTCERIIATIFSV